MFLTRASQSIPARSAARSSRVEAKRIGKFKLTLSAQMKGSANRADIVVREIEVVPNGREQNTVFNGRLDASGQVEPPRTRWRNTI